MLSASFGLCCWAGIRQLKRLGAAFTLLVDRCFSCFSLRRVCATLFSQDVQETKCLQLGVILDRLCRSCLDACLSTSFCQPDCGLTNRMRMKTKIALGMTGAALL